MRPEPLWAQQLGPLVHGGVAGGRGLLIGRGVLVVLLVILPPHYIQATRLVGWPYGEAVRAVRGGGS